MKTSFTIPLAIALGGLIVAGAVYFALHKSELSTSSGSGDPSLVRPVAATDHILGNPAAPITIIEYADYDCSYCKDFDQSMQEIIADEGASGKVSWVFRNFPITELHPDAYKAAEAAECVAQVAGNDAYWKFADSLFVNQPVAPTDFAQYALAAGADPQKVATCEENASSTVDAEINADIQNAQAVGAQGTPYSLLVVSGQAPIVIDGDWPESAIENQIDQALSSISASQ